MANQHALNQPAEPSALSLAGLKKWMKSRMGLKIMGGIFLFGTWEICVQLFAARFVTKPSGVIRVAPEVLGSSELWMAAWSTLSAVIIGLAIALVLGTIIGVAMGRVASVNRAAGLWVNSFYAMPMIAVLPILTMWFGYNEAARFATIIFAALFSIIINVADGVRSTPREYLEVARAFRAPPSNIWFNISLFSSVPNLIAGIRLAVGRALVGAVLAEIFASVSPGMGMYILANARALHQNEAMVAVVILALFGITMDMLVNGTLKKYFPWYRREQ